MNFFDKKNSTNKLFEKKYFKNFILFKKNYCQKNIWIKFSKKKIFVKKDCKKSQKIIFEKKIE